MSRGKLFGWSRLYEWWLMQQLSYDVMVVNRVGNTKYERNVYKSASNKRIFTARGSFVYILNGSFEEHVRAWSLERHLIKMADTRWTCLRVIWRVEERWLICVFGNYNISSVFLFSKIVVKHDSSKLQYWYLINEQVQKMEKKFVNMNWGERGKSYLGGRDFNFQFHRFCQLTNWWVITVSFPDQLVCLLFPFVM